MTTIAAASRGMRPVPGSSTIMRATANVNAIAEADDDTSSR
jgi:hypothetical protein